MTQPVNLHPKIDGVWARQIGAFGEVEIEHAWPHGNDSASWAFPAGTTHRALHAGATVEIFDGGVRVWKGVLQEVGLDGKMTARGLWTEGEDAIAIDSVNRITTNPDYAVNDGITRGALTWNSTRGTPYEIPSVPMVADDKTIYSVAGLLDAYAAKNGKRWGIDPNGNVLIIRDPTEPSWHVPHAAAGRGLTPADDDFATDLYGIYLAAGEERAFVTVGDAEARTAYGRRVERTVDLTDQGVISSTLATTLLTSMLALSAARLRFADGLDLQYGQITTPGGAPAPLSQVRAGQVVRLHGVKDPRGVNGLVNYTDVLIGKSRFDTSTQTLSIAPVDAAPRGLDGALESGSGAASGIDARVPSLLKPIGYSQTTVGTVSNLPNDGIQRTLHIGNLTPPANAVFAQISLTMHSQVAGNAAVHWYPNVSNGTGGYVAYNDLLNHNQGNAALDVGFAVTFLVDVRPHVAAGSSVQIVVNGSNDPGSSAWAHIGYLNAGVTWLGF